MSNDLITAAQQGNLDHVILCIETGEDPKKWNSQALSEAAIHNHLEIVKYLTPLSDVNADCAVALRNAFLHNNTDIVNFLWDQVDHVLLIEQTQYVQRPSPFQLACQYGFYHHALSLFQYSLHRDLMWKVVFYLPKISNDPLCLELWDRILTRVGELEDPYRFILTSWYEKTLPGLNILKIMARHLINNDYTSELFLRDIARNWSSEGHLSAVFPMFEHMFDNFDNDSKQAIVAKTITYDPILCHALIRRCPTTQFLCSDVVKEILHADMDALMDMIQVCKAHPYPYSKKDREFDRLEQSLMDRIPNAPEKVWCVVEHFPQLLTPQIISHFIRLQNDYWTAKVCAHSSEEELEYAQRYYLRDDIANYFNEYQNRVQRATLNQELSAYSGTTVVRKI